MKKLMLIYPTSLLEMRRSKHILYLMGGIEMNCRLKKMEFRLT